MPLWKFLLLGFVIFVVLALPAFYFISGELTWDIVWEAGLPILIALIIIYFLFFNKKNKRLLFHLTQPDSVAFFLHKRFYQL